MVGREPLRVLDRYAVFDEFAYGGMATVHLGRLFGPAGFARTVALKRLLPQFAREPEFLAMFMDEARLASRVRHPNIVSVLDVVEDAKDFFLVMEYVHGQSLSHLQRAMGGPMSPPLALAIADAMLQGLHAAHEATAEDGTPLEIVHRDVSPQNVLIGADGVARVVDFGIATASVRLQTTRSGQLKGKLAYMAPEQLRGQPATRRADIYSVGVVLWEMLTGCRLFGGDNEAAIFGYVLEGRVPPPSAVMAQLSPSLDRVVLQAIDREAQRRFPTALEMSRALEAVGERASAREVGQWVVDNVGAELASRAELIRSIEAVSANPHRLEEARSAVHQRVRRHSSRPPEVAGMADAAETLDERQAALALGALAVSPAGESMESQTSIIAPVRTGVGRRTPWTLVVAGALAALLATSGLLWRQSADLTSSIGQRGIAAAAAAVRVPEGDGAGSPVVEPEIETEPPAAEEVPSVSSAAPSTQPARPREKRHPIDNKPAGKVDCDPPWVFDADGIKRYKRGCW